MKKLVCILMGGLLLWGVSTSSAMAATIGLFEYAFNLDGTVVLAGASINTAGFDSTTGLGAITISIAGTGNHWVLGFFDHEIDEAINTFFNEAGSPTGVPVAGQSWEIDEPGYVFGDIYDNFIGNTLDNAVGTSDPEDVSMGMGWNFFLADGETATITFVLSEIMPTSGFYLTHHDQDSQASIYFSSAISTTGNPVPEPTSLLLFGSGIAFCARWIRRKSKS